MNDPIDLDHAADAAIHAFVETFWDPRSRLFFTNSNRRADSRHAFGPDDGLYSDFWWSAQLWELVMDAYERTHDADYRRMLDDVYDGFVARYPGFENDYNDDVGWWALASVRAHRLTGDERYLRRAIGLFATLLPHIDAFAGGGLWWRRSVRDQKNVATNAPAVMTAVALYESTAGHIYLTTARRLFAWLRRTLQAGGRVYDRIEADGTPNGSTADDIYTYNFGTYVGAATALHRVTNDNRFLDEADRVAGWSVTHLGRDGLLPDEGTGDGGGFKMIYARYLHQFARTHRPAYVEVIEHNAATAWRNRRTDDLIGPDWSAPPPQTPLQSLTCAAAADLLQVAAMP